MGTRKTLKSIQRGAGWKVRGAQGMCSTQHSHAHLGPASFASHPLRPYHSPWSGSKSQACPVCACMCVHAYTHSCLCVCECVYVSECVLGGSTYSDSVGLGSEDCKCNNQVAWILLAQDCMFKSTVLSFNLQVVKLPL